MFWIRGKGIRILNVAGPRASKDPFIYDDVRAALKVAVRGLLGSELKNVNL
ncbi:MAG: putative molybdenum carrier protein [bacterium]